MALKSNLVQDQLGNIYYRKMIQGHRVTIPAYTKSVTIANKLHTTLEYQALMEHYAPKEKKQYRTFNQLVELYLKDLDVLARWTEQTKEVTSYVLRKYGKNKQLPDNKETARGYQTRINALLKWAEDNNFKTDIKPMAVFKKQGRSRVFNERELSLILNEFQDDDFQDFIKFAYYTGARRGEINSLKPHQIEPTRMVVYGKTGERYIKLNSQAKHVLYSREKIWEYTGDFITKKFKANARMLDIKDARFHDLRRTFGLNLIKAGMPIFEVSKLLGHKNVSTTTEHYAPLLVDDIKDFTL